MENKITEQITTKEVKSNTKKVDSVAIRFDKAFMKQVTRIVNKANKKQFGRKIKPKAILQNLLDIVDESVIEKVIKKTQDESLTIKDRKEMNFKQNMSLFGGSKEKYEQKMMELMDNYLSANPT